MNSYLDKSIDKWEKNSLREAIIELLNDKGEMKLQDIYTDIFSYYDATDSQNLPDKKYPYATVLQHAIRSHLARLRKERVVVSLKRAHYKLLK